MTFKEIFVNCKFQYIEAIEQELLDEGLARMSTYFGEYHVYENGMPAKHLFWDHDEYYYFICLNPESKERVMVWCSDCLGTEYELLDEFSADLSGMELKQRIKKIIDVWKPKQERILKKYIDMNAIEPFPYNIYSMSICLQNGGNSCYMQIKNLEADKIDYIFGIDLELDILYEQYKESLRNENYTSSMLTLCKLYELALRKLGEMHDNIMALLYELLRLSYEVEGLTPKDLLSVHLLLYNYNKNKYGNNHYATICAISGIAANLSSLKKYEDGIVLARYVHKALQRKYGRTDEKSIEALMCVAWHLFDHGRYGHALSMAEQCIELCKNREIKVIYSCYQCIAMIYRTECFEDYEKALEYELQAQKYLEKYSYRFEQ